MDVSSENLFAENQGISILFYGIRGEFGMVLKGVFDRLDRFRTLNQQKSALRS